MRMHSALLVAAMALGTILLRFLPFLIFRRGRALPRYIAYLGEVLPQAIIAMLVVYCLRETDVLRAPHGLPELIAAAAVVVTQVWRRNALVSILTGTVLYMVLTQVIFL